MAWEWSHTEEAYINAYNNLCQLSEDDLIVIWSEIKSSSRDEYFNYDLDLDLYNDYYKLAKSLINFNKKPILINEIWTFASEELKTCDNGGFNAYLCPYGCHTVSFDYKGE